METGPTMASESISSAFPNRSILPLPRRRLRERLAPDVAESIKYPPAQLSSTPLFYYPYSLKDEAVPDRANVTVVTRSRPPASIAGPTGQDLTTANIASATATTTAAATATTNISPTPKPRQGTAEEPDQNGSSRVFRLVSRTGRPVATTSATTTGSSSTTPTASETQPVTAVISATSSVDGYDSFENTNNKKKRKIPTASDVPHSSSSSGGGGGYVSTDLHSATSSSSTNDESLGGGSTSSTADSATASFVSGSSGISGPGRGRYGRTRNGRSPLRPLSDAGSNWAGRYGKLRSPWTQSGIISSAIASAEKPSQDGQENDTPLSPQSTAPPTTPANKPSPASAQFTFTCSSQVPGNLTWPGSDPKFQNGGATATYWQQGRRSRGSGGGGGSSGGGYGSMPGLTMRGGSYQQGLGSPMSSSAADRLSRGSVDSRGKHPQQHRGGGRGGEGGQKKKKGGRSKLSRELEAQARERRRLQQEQNRTNGQEEFYVCSFCDFEIINGYKPKYLIRSFEMRARNKQLEDDRRHRNVDKAKARNRKGKKASRTAGGGGGGARNGSASGASGASGGSGSGGSSSGLGNGGGMHGPRHDRDPEDDVSDDGQTGDEYEDDDDDEGDLEVEVDQYMPMYEELARSLELQDRLRGYSGTDPQTVGVV